VSLADKLNLLFDTHHKPDGQPYLLREVADGTGGKVSVAYLSLLRRGGIAHPPFEKVQALADFFGVDARYFADQEADEGEVDPSIERARQLVSAQPHLREMALAAGAMTEEEQEAVLQLIKSARDLYERLKKNAQG